MHYFAYTFSIIYRENRQKNHTKVFLRTSTVLLNIHYNKMKIVEEKAWQWNIQCGFIPVLLANKFPLVIPFELITCEKDVRWTCFSLILPAFVTIAQLKPAAVFTRVCCSGVCKDQLTVPVKLFYTGEKKNKRHRQAQMYFLIHFCHLTSTLIFFFFIPALQLAHPLPSELCCNSPFAPESPAHMSSFINSNDTQALASFCLVQFILGFLSDPILKLGCHCYRQCVNLCFASVYPCISCIFMLKSSCTHLSPFFDTINCSTASIV